MTAVFAHRGVHRAVRENTLDAFRAAIDLGVDGVELDVRQTGDGALVIHHDPTISGRAVAHMVAADLPAYVPRLDEAMTVLRGLSVNVEIKNSRDPDEPTYDGLGAIVRSTLEYLREASWMDAVMISCFDLATCDAVRSHDPEVTLAWLVDEGSLSESLKMARDLGLNAVNPHYSMLTEENRALARELDLAINAWTVNHANDLTTMADLEVASVITDDPSLALDLYGR
jgi:glycerophosphoryl diester phosphodiesterase